MHVNIYCSPVFCLLTPAGLLPHIVCAWIHGHIASRLGPYSLSRSCGWSFSALRRGASRREEAGLTFSRNEDTPTAETVGFLFWRGAAVGGKDPEAQYGTGNQNRS
jgi:hypothetical protein